MKTETTQAKFRICFVPFDQPHQAEFVENSKIWNDEGVNLKKPKTYTVIAYDGSKKPELLTLSSDSTIYIRGHGSKGGLDLSTNVEQGAEKIAAQKLSIENVCQRLMDSGLQPSFAGKIKFSNCNSALADPYTKGRETPSALRGARYFRRKGYWKCRIFGYTGAFDGSIGFPEKEDPNRDIDASLQDGYRHKIVTTEKTKVARSRDMRASLARKEFRPLSAAQRSYQDFMEDCRDWAIEINAYVATMGTGDRDNF